MQRYIQWLTRIARYDKNGAICAGGETLSYRELMGEVERWRQRFTDHGIGAGHIIAARCDYSVASISAMLAILANQGVIALIPRGGDFDHFLAESQAQTRLEIDAAGSHRLLPARQPAPSSALLDRLAAEHCGGFIIFTSGSTGVPKAALHSIERFISRFEKPGRQFRTLAFSTLDHIAGLDTLFYTLSSGGTVVLTESRLPLPVIQVIERDRVQVLPTSPSFLRMLCACDALHKADLSSLAIITYGSEPMDEHTLATVNRHFPHIEIRQKYGSTELGAPKTMSRGNNSLWVRFRDPSLKTKIIDGLLWVRSNRSNLGYLNAPLELDPDGWYCTGDLVESDDGWLKFLGRQGECVNVGGQKVYPTEVEAVIRELSFVQDVIVSGEAHALLGQVVAARVAVSSGESSTDPRKDIRQHCQQRLSPYKVPMRVTIVDRIEITDRQKRSRITSR